MFLIRCLGLEQDYEEYCENSSPKPPTHPTKPRSGTDAELGEHIADLPVKQGSVSSVYARNTRPQSTSGHKPLGRCFSAGLYGDDVFLVNYEKYARDDIPYVYDDRKTSM